MICNVAVFGDLKVNKVEIWSHWLPEEDPANVGRKIAENWLNRPFEFETKEHRDKVIYPEVCTWFGAMELARLGGAGELISNLVERFERFRGSDVIYISQKRHVDDSIFGVIPLELYLIGEGDSNLSMGLHFADRQWEHPDEKGLSEECRYWIDDLYMLPLLQVQAYRASGNRVYLNRAARTFAAYLEVLQQPNGLFHHAPDSPFFWGRGNGWVAAGMAELLRELRPEDEHYEAVVSGYRKMMATLLSCQAPSGLWRQLIDDPESWEESSCTGMFTFAMITGLKLGLLDEKIFGPAARKGWLALVEKVNDESLIEDVCVGTNKAAQVVGTNPVDQRNFYLSRPRKAGDLHGQAPILWCAAALLR